MTMASHHRGAWPCRLRPVVLGVLLALGATSAPAAAADPVKTTSPADAAMARRHYEDGVAAAAAKEWQKAQLAFAEAWRLKQHWQIAVNLGQAELKMGMHRDAAEHLAYYLREATELHADDVKQANRLLDEAKAKVGTMKLNVAPKGAQVFVDGKLAGTAPFAHEIYVEPGWHAVEGRNAEVKELRQVEAPIGQAIEVRLGVGVPDPLPTKSSTSPGKAGADTLRLAVAASGGTLALVNLVVGAVTAGVSSSKSGEQDKLCKPQCPASPSVRAAWNQLEGERVGAANGSVAAFVIAGLAAAGTVTAFVLMRPKPARARAPVPIETLQVAPTAGGVIISGSF